MMTISPASIKALRGKSGAGMMDCKRALESCDGDAEKALDWLRKKGVASAQKKAARVAAEGVVALSLDASAEDTIAAMRGALVEVNAETDFVARNDDFQSFVAEVARAALDVEGDMERLLASARGTGASFKEAFIECAAKIGENITLRRSAALTSRNGAVGGYVHNRLGESMGKIGVLVSVESLDDGAVVSPEQRALLAGLARRVAMHIAAAKPSFLARAHVPPAVVAREREIFSEQARQSGKPDAAREKMVEGRLRKFYEDSVLLDQQWILEDAGGVVDVLAAAGKEIGLTIGIGGFLHFVCGEGIERKEDDFAASVAAAASG